MATKHTDSCFQHAEDDEPLFTLLARDPLAPVVIGVWALLRQETGGDKVTEALEVAEQMKEWRHVRRPHKTDIPPETVQRVLLLLGASIR